MNHSGLPQLDFVIASMGDWHSNFRASGEWQDTLYTWSRITELNADHQKVPYFFVYGNHDISNFEDMDWGCPVNKERMGRNISGMNENNYAFMYNNVLFICAAQTNNLYTLSGFQQRWIEYLLERYPDKTTVILTHQGTKDTNGNGDTRTDTWGDEDYLVHNDITWWRAIFRNNPQIKLYIHGHNEKGYNTTSFDAHSGTWDDNCIFVLVPSNGRGDKWENNQDGWSYIFSISDDDITIRLWNSSSHSYQSISSVAIPYMRTGMENNVSNSSMEWYSIPKRVLDGQEWSWNNHMIAERYHLELIGSNQTEQIDNPELDGCHESDEKGGTVKLSYWYAVQGDAAALNKATGETDGYIKIAGARTIALSTRPSYSGGSVEGKVPYNTAVAVPGKTYIFSARIRTDSGTGSVDFWISIPKYPDISKFVWNKKSIRSDIVISGTYKTYTSTFTIPANDTGWFIQPHIHFDDSETVYFLENWSLKMAGNGEYTNNFSVTLNNGSYTVSDDLRTFEYNAFELPVTSIGNLLAFNASIDGNRVGIARLIYERPLLWSDDVTIGIMDANTTSIRLEDRSPYNNRTSLMAFEGVNLGVDGFDIEVVRGKYSFFNGIDNGSIDGTYYTFPISTVGVHLTGSNDNDLSRMNITGFATGVILRSSVRNTVDNSTLELNTVGVRVIGTSKDNGIHHSILDNIGSNVRVSMVEDINASHNHWGSIDPDVIDGSIIDELDDPVLGRVWFSPWSNRNFTTYFEDTLAPVTTDDHDGEWHNDDVTINLTAVDDLSGVAATYYRIDGGTWNSGSTISIPAPSDHSNDGTHIVGYYSVDHKDHTESINTVIVRIDTAPPELRFRYDAARDRLRQEVSDSLDHSPIKTVKKIGAYRTITLTDHAGNVAEIKLWMSVKTRNGWTFRKVMFQKVRYNDEPWLYFDQRERFALKTKRVDRVVVEMEQFATGGTWRIDATYSEASRKTTIRVRDGSWSMEIHTGVKVADIVIRQGICGYRIP